MSEWLKVPVLKSGRSRGCTSTARQPLHDVQHCCCATAGRPSPQPPLPPLHAPARSKPHDRFRPVLSHKKHHAATPLRAGTSSCNRLAKIPRPNPFQIPRRLELELLVLPLLLLCRLALLSRRLGRHHVAEVLAPCSWLAQGLAAGVCGAPALSCACCFFLSNVGLNAGLKAGLCVAHGVGQVCKATCRALLRKSWSLEQAGWLALARAPPHPHPLRNAHPGPAQAHSKQFRKGKVAGWPLGEPPQRMPGGGT